MIDDIDRRVRRIYRARSEQRHFHSFGDGAWPINVFSIQMVNLARPKAGYQAFQVKHKKNLVTLPTR